MVGDRGPHLSAVGKPPHWAPRILIVDVRLETSVKRHVFGMRRFQQPIGGHVGIENHVAVAHGNDEIQGPVLQPGAHVEALSEVELLRRQDARPDLDASVRPPHYPGYLVDKPGQLLGQVLGFFRLDEGTASRNRQVELHSFDGVPVHQLLEDGALAFADFRGTEALPPPGLPRGPGPCRRSCPAAR